MRYLLIVTCKKALNQYKLCKRKNWSMAIEKQESAWLNKEQLLIIKLSEGGKISIYFCNTASIIIWRQRRELF
jgi:hypothetical protein